jgi:predicted nuclease with RNAse H fold
MRTVGIDLSAEPKKTAAAAIVWPDADAESAAAAGARVEWIRERQDDEALLLAVEGADKAGIDCPLGWPEPFIDFVTAHRDRGRLLPHDLTGRRHLAYRTTDLVLMRDHDSPNPLSVSADRIGHAAMRAAGLLAALVDHRHRVDRTGRTGLVVEVYPAALRLWGLTRGRYKGTDSATERAKLLSRLMRACPWLSMSKADKARCKDSDDAFDAVVCALVARAAALGKVQPPNRDQIRAAATEGWIAVPTCPLSDLAGAAGQ